MKYANFVKEKTDDKGIVKMEKEFKFLPKPFVFLNDIVPHASAHVYMPNRKVHKDEKDHRTFVCVHICKKFQSYDTTNFGIKVIPDNVKCRFAVHGVCNGACLAKDGKLTHAPAPENWLRYQQMDNLKRPGR
jgi:hypothetical protein